MNIRISYYPCCLIPVIMCIKQQQKSRKSLRCWLLFLHYQRFPISLDVADKLAPLSMGNFYSEFQITRIICKHRHYRFLFSLEGPSLCYTNTLYHHFDQVTQVANNFGENVHRTRLRQQQNISVSVCLCNYVSPTATTTPKKGTTNSI